MASSIYEKIEQKGASDAQEIYRIGQEKAKTLEENILNEAKKEKEQILNKGFERDNNRLKTKTTQLEQKSKQKTLLKKKELISNAFNLAKQRLKELNDEELFALIVKMIQSEKLKGDETIKVSNDDYSRYLNLFSSKKMIDGYILLDKLNEALGDNFNLKLSQEKAEINGGFIIVGTTFDIDHSFKTLLDNLKEKLEAEIADMLFTTGE